MSMSAYLQPSKESLSLRSKHKGLESKLAKSDYLPCPRPNKIGEGGGCEALSGLQPRKGSVRLVRHAGILMLLQGSNECGHACTGLGSGWGSGNESMLNIV